MAYQDWMAQIQGGMSPQAQAAYALLSNQFPQTLPIGQTPQSASQSGSPMQQALSQQQPQQGQQSQGQDFGQQMMDNYAKAQAGGNSNYGLTDAMGDTASQKLGGVQDKLNAVSSCCGS